jgi:aminoglycoside phosphotransferase (APT) family kinase protein
MVAMTKMHDHEIMIDAALVRHLLSDQFPAWAGQPLARVPSSGTDNALFRLGDDMAVRLPRIAGATGQVEKDLQWLPRMSPALHVSAPVPLGLGQPGRDYPWTWGVYEWIAGAEARPGDLADPDAIAADLAVFLADLKTVDTAGGPAPNLESGRGCPLPIRDEETRAAIAALEGEIDTRAANAAWDDALEAAPYSDPPAWIHGDLLPGNLLVRDGRLVAVIDWSCLGLGDTACDLIPAWSLLSGRSRQVFRDRTGADDAAWRRGRGWALSIAVIQLPYYMHTNPGIVATARRTVAEVLADHAEIGTAS